MREEELVQRAQAGDQAAFCQLVLSHQQFAYNLALRSLGDPSEAEDVAQEAFLRAWLSLPRFRRGSQFRTWLYRIVVNLCYNRLPALRRQLEALPVVETLESGDPLTWGDAARLSGSEWEQPAPAVEAAEQRRFLHCQVEALPESYRMLISLRYDQDLSYDEIATITGMPLGTVKTGLHRAHNQLRQALRQYEEAAV
jgi:RNA polymerase sigma-70 factor, ECF subfamily